MTVLTVEEIGAHGSFQNAGPGDPSASWRIGGSAYAMSDDFVATLPSKHLTVGRSGRTFRLIETQGRRE